MRPWNWISWCRRSTITRKITIELSSHTDSRGKDAYNQALSQRRAQSAVDYIISKGIDKARITAKGYGESRPVIKDAKTEEELPAQPSHGIQSDQNHRIAFYHLKLPPPGLLLQAGRFVLGQEGGYSAVQPRYGSAGAFRLE